MYKVYDFRCKECKKTYEFEIKEPDFYCCNNLVTRTYSVGGIQFRGSGFYKNDARSKK